MNQFFKSFLVQSIWLIIGAIIINAALLAGAVWLIVTVLKMTGVIHS